MTLPNEECRAVKQAGQFLTSLLRPAETPRVPLRIRIAARDCLRHFPAAFQVDDLYARQLAKMKRQFIVRYRNGEPL